MNTGVGRERVTVSKIPRGAGSHEPSGAAGPLAPTTPASAAHAGAASRFGQAPPPGGALRRVQVQRLTRPASGSSHAREPATETLQSHAEAGTSAAEPGSPAAPRYQDATTGVEKGGSGERRNWVAQLTDGLWPFAREAAQRLAWEVIPSQLEASRPSFVYALEMQQFTLGGALPSVHDIRVHHSGEGEMFLEFEIEWTSQQDISLLIMVPRLPVAVAEITPDPLEDALRLLMRLRVALRNAWVRAGVRVTLRPLLNRLPVVGAVQVGLTRLPQFGYELDLSLASAALVPLLKQWLDGAIRDLVLQPWVLPEHYFYPLDPGIPDVDRLAGVLSVQVLGAEQARVPKPGLLGSARPMLELFLRATQRRQTHAAPAGRSASWGGSCFEFPVSVPEHQELTVISYDYNDWSPNEELGRASLALRVLPAGQEREVVLELRAGAEEKHDEEQGKLSGLERAALAVGRPFTKKSSEVCQLRLLVTYVPLTGEQSRIVREQQCLPVTLRTALPAAAAAEAEAKGLPAGQCAPATPAAAPGMPLRNALPPAALRLLGSGMLIVGVPQVDGLLQGPGMLGMQRMFRRYYKTVVRVGTRHAESDAALASRQGVVQFSLPVCLHLPADAVQDEAAEVVVEVLEHGWVGAPASRGRMCLSLRELAQGSQVQGERRLGNSHAKAQLNAYFQPYF